MYPIFSIYVWKIFELQVQNLYAFQKFQVFSYPQRPETQLQQQQGHQWASAYVGSIKKTSSVKNRVEREETNTTLRKNVEKSWLVFTTNQRVVEDYLSNERSEN